MHKQQSHLITCNLLTKHTHTHTLNQSVSTISLCWEKVGLECRSKGRNWLRKSDVFWKCVPECWSGVRARAFTVCRRSEMPRGGVNLEWIGKIDRTSRSDSSKTKRTKFVFDSGIDWKPVQSAKVRCNVVCLRSFQDEASCIVLKTYPSVHGILSLLVFVSCSGVFIRNRLDLFFLFYPQTSNYF